MLQRAASACQGPCGRPPRPILDAASHVKLRACALRGPIGTALCAQEGGVVEHGSFRQLSQGQRRDELQRRPAVVEAQYPTETARDDTHWALTFPCPPFLRTARSPPTSTPSPWPPAPASTTTFAPSRGRMAPPPPSPSRTPTSRPSTAPATKRSTALPRANGGGLVCRIGAAVSSGMEQERATSVSTVA